MSGKRLAYWEGSASDSAALGFTRLRSSRHTPTTCTPHQRFMLLAGQPFAGAKACMPAADLAAASACTVVCQLKHFLLIRGHLSALLISTSAEKWEPR